jgi:hypothetical protein
MTATLEIPKERWKPFLDEVSRHALGRLVRLEVESIELGDQEMSELQPLRGIELETKGSAHGSLLIMTGTDAEDMNHLIGSVSRIYVGHNETAEMEWLAIEDQAGGKTLVYFEELLAISPGEPVEEEERPAPA